MKYLIEPWEHQHRGINRAALVDEFAFLFDIGTGKTCASINTLRHWCQQANRVLNTLVLCPQTTILQWKEDEFRKHSVLEKHCVPLVGPGTKRLKLVKERFGKPTIFITNHETLLMKPVVTALLNHGVEVGIFDEAQKFKTPTAKRTKAAAKLSETLKKKLVLTGSKLQPMDYFSIYLVLDNGKTFGKNFFVYRAKYFFDKNAGMPKHSYFPDWRPRPGSFKELNGKIYQKAMLAKKEDCLDLPPLVRQKVYVEMTPEQKRAYKQMEEDLVAYLDSGAAVATMALTKVLRLQQIVTGFVSVTDPESQIAATVKAEVISKFENVPRVKALKEILEEITPEHKVIVWACFAYNYQQIRKICDDLKLPMVEITGQQTAKQNQAAITEFRADDKIRVCMANQRAGGVGVNLTEASYSIYFSRTYSLDDDLQSEGRNYRGGSERHSKITRIDLVTPDTVDSDVLSALSKKLDIAKKILEMKNGRWQ